MSGWGPGGHVPLFDERGFEPPEPPPVSKAEAAAKLPWFWFLDVDEAKAFIRLFGLGQTLGFVLVLNFWIFKSPVLFWLVFPPAMVVQVLYLRVWIGLCQRAQPRLSRWQWFMSGWANPRTRHCLAVARGLVTDVAPGRDRRPA